MKYLKQNHKCEECGRQFVRIRGLIEVDGKMLCASCRSKLDSYREMLSVSTFISGNIKLKDALKREYNVKSYKNGKYFQCVINLPSCFSGKKVMVKLVKENNFKEEKTKTKDVTR